MPVSLRDIPKVLGVLGTTVGILTGVVALAPHLQTKPNVYMWIEKAQLSGTPAAGNDPNSVHRLPVNFGAVTVAISNESLVPIEKPQLRFVNLQGFKGIVVADGLTPSQAQEFEHVCNRKITDNPDDTLIDLPALNVGAGIKVQAFGTNWKYVDPVFYGVNNPRRTWIIAVDDSRVHQYLFEYHLWIVSLVIFVTGCILLVVSRPSGLASVPRKP
jgi:hypothetical protein